jgi:hypothetical protein
MDNLLKINYKNAEMYYDLDFNFLYINDDIKTNEHLLNYHAIINDKKYACITLGVSMGNFIKDNYALLGDKMSSIQRSRLIKLLDIGIGFWIFNSLNSNNIEEWSNQSLKEVIIRRNLMILNNPNDLYSNIEEELKEVANIMTNKDESESDKSEVDVNNEDKDETESEIIVSKNNIYYFWDPNLQFLLEYNPNRVKVWRELHSIELDKLVQCNEELKNKISVRKIDVILNNKNNYNKCKNNYNECNYCIELNPSILLLFFFCLVLLFLFINNYLDFISTVLLSRLLILLYENSINLM